MRIETATEPEISPELDQAIRALQMRAFPTTELFRLGRHYKHAARLGDVRVLAWEGEQLVAQVVLFWGQGASSGGWSARLAGIGNVCSDPAWRGKGLALACMTRAMELARQGGAEFVLLFCAPQRKALYERFGFVEVGNDWRLSRPDGQRYLRDRHDIRMVAPLSARAWPVDEVTLDVEDF